MQKSKGKRTLSARLTEDQTLALQLLRVMLPDHQYQILNLKPTFRRHPREFFAVCNYQMHGAHLLVRTGRRGVLLIEPYAHPSLYVRLIKDLRMWTKIQKVTLELGKQLTRRDWTKYVMKRDLDQWLRLSQSTPRTQ